MEIKIPTAGNNQPPSDLRKSKFLNPVDRISEILFGLIMALTFTCTISIADADRAEVRDMLIGAIGCNIAWGLVDAVMFILTGLAERGHGKKILNFIRTSNQPARSKEFIADALPPVVAEVLDDEQLEKIRKGLLSIPESQLQVKVTWVEIRMAIGIFLLVFLSTLPVAVPFIFIDTLEKALRVSNLVATILMFTSGWFLAKYGGYNKWITALSMTLIGVLLVGLTIALGG